MVKKESQSFILKVDGSKGSVFGSSRGSVNCRMSDLNPTGSSVVQTVDGRYTESLLHIEATLR